MVYRGKPSQGCQRCRRRKIRCDLRYPSCTACERAGQYCTGYRSQLDLMFVDETTNVVHRQRHRQAKTQDSSRTQRRTVIAPQYYLPPGDFGPSSALPTSTDDFALSYCYKHHILHQDPESSTMELVRDTTFLKCMKAVGLASFSNMTHSSIAAAKAQMFYIDAIQSTNAALSSTDCTSDYTLLSVMALAFFESISGPDARSLEVWKRHVQGMASLLILRGLNQIQTSDGRLLFLTAAGSLGAKCLMLGIRLPLGIQELMDEATLRYGSKEDPLWRICSKMVYLTNLYSDVRSGILTDRLSIVARAAQLDEEIADGFAYAPDSWKFAVRPFIAPADLEIGSLFLDSCHVYSNVMAAQQWNVMRIGRIICNAIIQFAALRPDCHAGQDPDRTLAAKASSVILQMQLGVLATAPQYLGLIDEQSHITSRQKPEDAYMAWLPEPRPAVWKTANIQATHLPSLRLGRAHQLLWSVGLVARAVDVSHPMRVKACRILRLAGEAHGMSQGFAFAEALEKDRTSSGGSCSLFPD